MGASRLPTSRRSRPGRVRTLTIANGDRRAVGNRADYNQIVFVKGACIRGCDQYKHPSRLFFGFENGDKNAVTALLIVEIVGLEKTRTETLVRYELEPGQTQVHRLSSTETAFTVPKDPGVLDILSSYVALGVTHILEGLDHLLFVFALVLLVRDRSRLFWAITAFTVAHSITLASATLGWVNIPPPPVEAVIALSIVFLAYELSLSPENRDPFALRFPWVVSFAFGLIHGLGFAGALREIGLPEGDIPLALFAFNFGVELGQILFIVVVLAMGLAARFIYPAIKDRAVQLERVTSYGIGSLAAFWVIDRIAGF